MICCTPPPPPPTPPGAGVGTGAGAGARAGAGAEVMMLCWILMAGGGGGGGRLEAEFTRFCLTERFCVFVVTALEGFVVIGSSTGGPGLRGGGGGSGVT